MKRTKGWYLTRSELVVLKYLRDGLKAKQIAAEMGIEEVSAKAHMSNIYRKFKVTDRLSLHRIVGFH